MYVPKLFNKVMDRAALKLKNANSQFMSQINDLVGGFTVFKNHQQTATFAQRILQASDLLGQTNVAYTQKIEAVSDGIGTLSIFSQIFTTGWTAFLIFKKLVNVGVVGTAANLSGLLFSNLSKITTNLFTMRSVQAILTVDLAKQAASVTTNHVFNRQLKLTNISFAYQDKPVLQQIDYSFTKNGKYALIGKSGVGKSTLLNLIAGQLTGYQGTIELDQHVVSNCASEIEYVEQKPYLFNTTLRGNLTLGAAVATDTLNQICHDLQIDQFMTLDTPIVGHGQNLSGGQRQRIALARALVHRKPIIFLDEVTAGLDEQSAQQIETKLLQDPNLTLIMITHHLTEQTQRQLTGVLNLSAI
jgi:ABC-type bacteriocin/lantibiotic exporters, contain an N-terminal double-glycine peptidase domain